MRRIRFGDDRGSLAMALMLTLVGVSLSGLMVPVVVSQITTARVDQARINALNAAQAGIDAALGRIRAAADSSGVGSLLDLPCFPLKTVDSTHPQRDLQGTVTSQTQASYRVNVDYFSVDPLSAGSAAFQIVCSPLYGTPKTPAYALITSVGVDSVGNQTVRRTLTASYIFKTTNANIAGGLVHVYKTATSNDLCMDAGSATPAVGTPVRVQPCSPGNTQQKFSYNMNLTLQLTASVTAANALGMCLDAGTPHANGSIVVFQQCAAVTKPQQQWSFNDSANFEGTANGTTLDGYCMNVQNPDSAGSIVVLSNANCRKSYDNIENWAPDAAVGAGAAGPSTGQIVNFNQFGRCIDVTDQNVSSTFLIVWPCKQAPNVASLTWNQRWTGPAIPAGLTNATGRIYTTKSGTDYCMQSPGSTAAGQYVRVNPCPSSGIPTNMTWTVYGDTGTYLTSYRVVDGYGNCLVPTDPNATPPDFFAKGNQVSKLVVRACSGDTTQKWNAPPNILQPLPLKDIGEK
jgi:ricin-type beta-trefoil lectin protein